MTVLDKSRADWSDFKQGDEVLEEELEMHKRSGGQVGPGGCAGGVGCAGWGGIESAVPQQLHFHCCWVS